MSINFPLVLVLGTAFTGIVWLIDIFLLRPKRMAAAEAVQQKLGQSAGKGKDVKNFDSAVEEVLKEPVLVEYSISFFPVLFVVLILRSFLAEPFQIPTGSMIPTLLVGDFIVVNKYAYGIRLPVTGTKVFDVDDPKNGDVMVFIPPHKDEYFIKRVIGIPGDTVRYENKVLYINGVEQPQTFVARVPNDRPQYMVFDEVLGGVKHRIHRNPFSDPGSSEWTVPEGHYFMMGDNRDQSSDSRFWGLVSEDKIVGKAFAVWMHKEPGLSLPTFSRNGWIE